jgi:Uncharacterized protein involved in methicillin resistance
MTKINKIQFFDILDNLGVVPFTQSRGYVEMLDSGKSECFVFYTDNISTPTFALCGRVSVFAGKKMLSIEGECYNEKPDFESRKASQKFISKLQEFYSNLTKDGFDIVEIQSNTQWNFGFETALRKAGFLRPVGQFSMPVTRIIDLKKDIEYDRNWKRNLAKAVENNLISEIITHPQAKDISDFCSIYNNMGKRKKLAMLSEKSIASLLDDSTFRILFVKQGGERIAAIIFYIHNNVSTGVYAASSEKALATRASCFMYMSMFEHLTIQGCEFYDMAKLLPSSDDSIGKVFQFKNGVEGADLILNGEFAWYRKSYMRVTMYFVKKIILKKREL